MVLEIVTPGLEKNNLNAKDMIISTLAEQYPLTLTKLTNAVKKRFAVSISFQAIRKAVNRLADKGVVLKAGREYSLSKDWIWNLRDFAEKLEEHYFSEKIEGSVESIGQDIRVYNVKNLIDADKFLDRLIAKWVEEKPGDSFIQKAGHAHFAVGNTADEHKIGEFMKKFKVKFYTLVGGSSNLDVSITSFFRKQGFFYVSGEGDTSRYYAVYNDNLFQYELPKKFAEQVDEVFNKADSLENFDMAKLIELLRKDIGIKITVMKNELIAEQLRKSILSHFN